MRDFIEQIFLLAAFDVPVSASEIVLRWDVNVIDHGNGLIEARGWRMITEKDFYDWRGELAREAGWL